MTSAKNWVLGLVLAGVAFHGNAALVFNADLAAGWNPPGNQGQPNGAFAIQNALGPRAIELGLRAQQRNVGPVDPGNSPIYVVQPGGGNVAPNLAWWNFDWSASYSPGIGALDSLKLEVATPFLSTTPLVTYDLLALIQAALPNVDLDTLPTVQDSWNPMFQTVGVPGFSLALSSFEYRFELIATATIDGVAHRSSTRICVTTALPCNIDEQFPMPLPGTASLVGLSLLMLAGASRRRIRLQMER